MDALVVVEVTTTIDDSGIYVTKDSTEMVELAWIVLGPGATREELARESVVVRPVNTPITPLCTSQCGLSWDHVQDAGTFGDAIGAFERSIHTVLLSKGMSFSFVALSAWDLKVQLPREARDKQVGLPPWLAHPRVFDLKTEYSRWQNRHPEAAHFSASSLPGMCSALGVVGPLSSSFGPPQRAGQKVLTAAEVLRSLDLRALPRDAHPDVLTRPFDCQADLRAFLTENSPVLYMTNLSVDTTQSELESWFTQHGARPVAFWALLKSTPPGPGGSTSESESGFAVFGTHKEATDALAMNGRALNDRAIELAPSSTTVLAHAQSVLTAFPTSKNRPRPGDWTCPSCGFSNFQRRTACFRCQCPASSYNSWTPRAVSGRGESTPGTLQSGLSGPSLSGPSGGAPVPFRAGDWTCTNESCAYHNFAKNMMCLRCGGPRPAEASFRPPSHVLSQHLQPSVPFIRKNGSSPTGGPTGGTTAFATRRVVSSHPFLQSDSGTFDIKYTPGVRGV